MSLFSISREITARGRVNRDDALRRGTVTHFSRGCIPKMVLLRLLKRWEFCVMRASEGEARYERSAKKEKERGPLLLLR